MTEGPRRPTQHVESVLAVFPSPRHARDTSDNPDRLMPANPEDLADALAFALRHSGRRRVSNFDARDLEEAFAIAGQGEGRLACNQVLYHLEERAIEHAVLPWCERRGVAVTAYSPFGHGRFPGPYTTGGRLLAKIAAAHAATPRQVALAFLVRRPSLFAIPKASSLAHAAENAAAGEVRLSAAEIDVIDNAFPLGAFAKLCNLAA